MERKKMDKNVKMWTKTLKNGRARKKMDENVKRWTKT